MKKKTDKTPQWKLDQKTAKADLQAAKRGKHLWPPLTARLGINKFKRIHKGENFLISEFKKNAWATADPNKVEVMPMPAKIESIKIQPTIRPEGTTNHQRHLRRQQIREKRRELQNADSAS